MRTTLVTLFCALGLSACCMGSSDAPTATTDPSAPVPPSGAAPTAQAANPTTLAIGAPAVSITAVAAPRWSFTVAAPGEYQFDAVGNPADAQLTILNDMGWAVASDSDSGDGLDARLATFLAPGTYEVRVHEFNHAGATVHVSAQQLTPMTPVATIAPGAPPTTVSTPAGDWDRPASAEVALTIAAPGNYRLNARGDSSCTSYMTLIHDNAVVTTNSYGGPDQSAQIDQQLEAGTYTIRLRDTIERACTHTLTVVAQ